MNRRSFLRLAALTAGALAAGIDVVAPQAPVALKLKGFHDRVLLENFTFALKETYLPFLQKQFKQQQNPLLMELLDRAKPPPGGGRALVIPIRSSDARCRF